MSLFSLTAFLGLCRLLQGLFIAPFFFYAFLLKQGLTLPEFLS